MTVLLLYTMTSLLLYTMASLRKEGSVVETRRDYISRVDGLVLHSGVISNAISGDVSDVIVNMLVP